MSWVRRAMGSAVPNTNRLAKERSPYLLQHAHNPVDWYPWGEEAFEAAKSRRVPIFLSIGYSTCHWCHVMERESFSDEQIASVMNSNFVNIKVDREERPDVDAQYMTYVQMRTGHGGWPLSVFLTTDLQPFMGGTYFPPRDRQGTPGFNTLLLAISKAWREDQKRVLGSSAAVTAAIKGYFRGKALDETSTEPRKKSHLAMVKQAFAYFKSSFDEQYGGFGLQPKFPTPPNLHFLLQLHAFFGDPDRAALLGDQKDVELMRDKCQRMTTKTLDRIMEGGIRDHVEGGLHRYTVDRKWIVPHFEKMLYDQAQMASIYAIACRRFGQEKYLEMAREITDYADMHLASGRGAFYCATDADSLPSKSSTEKEEGAFATWTERELKEVLAPEDAEMFIKCYGNGPILHTVSPIESVAQDYGVTTESCKSVMRKCLAKLAAARARRPMPHRDEKILTEWNALMISAFVDVGDLEKAMGIVNYIRENFYQGGTLLRCTGQRAVSTDYAYLIRGLLDLFSVTVRKEYLDWAEALQRTMDEKFKDLSSGAYTIAERDAVDVIFPITEISDGALPSANAVAAENLLRLSLITDDPTYCERKDELLGYAGNFVKASPQSSPFLLGVLLWDLYGPLKVCLAKDLAGSKLLQELRRNLSFFVTVSNDDLSPSTVQVCRGTVCYAPLSVPDTPVDEVISSIRERLRGLK